MAKQYPMATSTIILEKPQSYELIEAQYRLIRYVIPDAFRYKFKNDNKYGLLHVALRSQLQVPYHTFEHDELDGSKKVVIYALYPKNANPTAVTLSFMSPDVLKSNEIDFDQIKLFNLVKLLQAEYFNVWPHFASMGNYYIHAKGAKDWHTCLSIKIRGANQNIDATGQEQFHQEYLVTGGARYFNRPSKHPDEFRKRRLPYFKRQLKDKFVIFEQLQDSQIDAHKDELFQLYSNKNNPARLVYHAQSSTGLQPSRGYILHQFITTFVDRLQALGIAAAPKIRNWLQYLPHKDGKALPQQLKKVYLCDARVNKLKHPTVSYQQLLAAYYPDIEFEVVEDIGDVNQQPALILQDTSARDYEEDGVLFGEEDPYKTIYRKHPNTPKQSINVNENSKLQFTGDKSSYLDYPIISLSTDDEEEDDETVWAIQFQVCFFQLYLKNVIFNRQPVSEFLPNNKILRPLMDYLYLRRQTYRGASYHVMLSINDNHLSFHDLRDPEQKNILSDITKAWGYDWVDVEDVLRQKYHKDKSEGEEVIDYDLILTKNSVVELEEMDETVLYKYDEIVRRLEARQENRPVESLKLTPHYDKLKPKGLLSYDNLNGLGLLNGRSPDGDIEAKSVAFWQQLQKYDSLLDDVRLIQSRVTYDEFVKMRRSEIGTIFNLPRNKNKQKDYMTNRILEYYKTIWAIGGFKGEDVQLSKGIWFDPVDNAYMVGDVNGFNDAQENANRIRRFNTLYGDKTLFNIVPFLEATGVQFIRYRQYTVYPFPFYLIEKYIHDVLFHRSE